MMTIIAGGVGGGAGGTVLPFRVDLAWLNSSAAAGNTRVKQVSLNLGAAETGFADPGASLAVLNWDDDQAADVLMVRQAYLAGNSDKKQAYVLSGEWVEEDVTYGPGTCFFAPKGERHGPHHARTEVISLTIFDGPLTVAG